MDMDQIHKKNLKDADSAGLRQQTSMGTLIVWNMTKAVEANPSIDLKSAIKTTQERLRSDGAGALESQSPEEQYLACALLAWQHLGHSSADSLFKFVESKRNECSDKEPFAEKIIEAKRPELCPGSFVSYDGSKLSNGVGSCSYDSRSLAGPVVKLPVETKIVMRLDNTPARPARRKPPEKDLKNRIDAACCMESACMEKLTQLDKATTELRVRAEGLARREAERVELLERAEAAWKDLELGYQRRLAMAEEKEDDMAKHIQKLIEERNGYKNACTTVAKQLRERGEMAEKERAQLTEVEKQVCENACMRLRLSEESAKLDAALAEQQCKASQLDRDLQFKEEQIRRKLQTMQSELESAQALTCEAERALHSELSALRQQVAKVSRQLLDEDAENQKIREEMDILRQEKLEMVEDLDGCKVICDGRIQGKMEELKRKRDQLNELKEKVMECQCKMPVDVSVEVKRTPSLAALCKCTPEDKYLESCSCTSLRTTLMSNLLADLFGGLQSELGGCTSQMPCQLLKCLEDRHNWDKTTLVKTNLRNYFSQLLIGELDIAIATSIEKYHAKWVGASCADAARMIPDRGGPETEGWQERALERRAQQLAAKLAEQLFQERAEELTAKAKEIVQAGPPPCECKQRSAAVFHCTVKPPVISSATPKAARGGSPTATRGGAPTTNSNSAPTAARSVAPTTNNGSALNPARNAAPTTHSGSAPITIRSSSPPTKSGTVPSAASGVPAPAYWRRTHQDVTQLKAQLEDLKKDSIKKEDLKIMEENIVKLVQRATESETIAIESSSSAKEKQTLNKDNSKQGTINKGQALKHGIGKKLSSIKKKQSDLNPKKQSKNIAMGLQINKPVRSFKKMGRSYAVNLCLCDPQSEKYDTNQNQSNLKSIPNKYTPSQISKAKPKQSISNVPSLNINIGKKSKLSTHPPCKSNCICFHKPPSNTSLDKLLETLAKWKCDLSNLDSKSDIESRKKHDAINNTSIIEGEYIDIMPGVNKRNEKILKNVSTKISNKQSSALFKSDAVVANVSKSTEFYGEMPGNTESEYMGAINLDKSNEHVCKCATGVGNIELSDDQNLAIFKCINSESCFCPKMETYNTQNDNIPELEIKTKDKNKLENKQNSGNSIPTEPKNKSDLNNIVKPSIVYPKECEYCIKFLGVTLTNATSNKVLSTKEKKAKNSRFAYSNPNNNGQNNDPKEWYNSVDTNSRSKPRDQLPTSICTIKHDEVNDTSNNGIKKQHGDFSKTEDKSLDAQSFKYTFNDQEGCVCCDTAALDESKDLELNAFHLLKEHLRDKLQEFKMNTCKSRCIPSAEEEKIFSTILQKVKQIITDNTSMMACKCGPQETKEGSWHRAYMLLQEYLKIKIKRVQCLCLSPEDNKDAVLPDVMEKVCNLIDNDFKRLKTICKCKHVLDPIELPEKDNSCPLKNTSTELQNVEKNSKEVSNRSLIVTQNISSQISPNIETETRSCDIMEIMNQGADTCQPNQCYRFTKPNYNNCFCIDSTRITKSHLEFGTKDVFVNQCIKVVQENKKDNLESDFIKVPDSNETDFFHVLSVEQQHTKHSPEQNKEDLPKSSPYIGYTVDCSCEGALGPCTCTKSLISGKNDNINSIWNTLTSNKLRYNDISYIMDAVPNKGLSEYNDPKTHDTIICQPVNFTCDTKVSAQYCEELTLKDSNTKANKTFLTTTASGEDISFDPNIGSETPIEWRECGSSVNHKTPILNDFSNNTCDDALYYPIRHLINHGTNEDVVKSDPIGSLSSSCDCNMVPMCHVKMLVENIENKLIHSKCTCDSMCLKICPAHSKIPVE